MLMFSQLMAHCDPNDAVQTLASVAKVESGFDTTTIHDNTTGYNPQAENENDAATIARELIARGHSIDLGLMQINSANLSRLGLSVSDAFDACRSIAAGSQILKEGYQQALRVAFSRYNTGDASRGFANGYVASVEAASLRLPAIGSGTLPPLAAPNTVPAPAKAAPARSWDAWDQDNQNAAVVAWDAPHDGAPASTAPAAAPLAAAPTEPPRPPAERVVMLQTLKNLEIP